MACWRSKCVPNTYYDILYFQILSWDQNNFASVNSDPKKVFKGYVSAKQVLWT